MPAVCLPYLTIHLTGTSKPHFSVSLPRENQITVRRFTPSFQTLRSAWSRRYIQLLSRFVRTQRAVLVILPNYMKQLKPARASICPDNTKARMGSKALCWVQLAWYRDNWRALVNTVMNIRVV